MDRNLYSLAQYSPDPPTGPGHEPVVPPTHEDLPHHRRRPLPPIGRAARFRDIQAPPRRHGVLLGMAIGLACGLLVAALLHVRPQPAPPPQIVASLPAPMAPAGPGAGTRLEIVPNESTDMLRTRPVPPLNAPPGTPPSDAEQKIVAEQFARTVMNHDTAKLAALLDMGANPNAEIMPGESALARTAWHGDPACAATLLAHGAMVDLPDRQGCTPLIWAASNGQLETVQVLLRYRADPDHRDNRGRTALMHAVWNGHLQVAGYLIEAGASLAIKDNEGHGIDYYAQLSEHPDMIDFIDQRIAAAGLSR